MNYQIIEKKIFLIFKKFGLNHNHSKICSKAIVNAELVGAYGHGLSRLKMYCTRISKQLIGQVKMMEPRQVKLLS